MIECVGTKKTSRKRMSLSISEECYEIIESTVLGIDMLQKLMLKEGDIDVLYENTPFVEADKQTKKLKSEYRKNKLNRSDVVERFIMSLRDEKIFAFNKQMMSIFGVQNFLDTMLKDLNLRTGEVETGEMFSWTMHNTEIESILEDIAWEYYEDNDLENAKTNMLEAGIENKDIEISSIMNFDNVNCFTYDAIVPNNDIQTFYDEFDYNESDFCYDFDEDTARAKEMVDSFVYGLLSIEDKLDIVLGCLIAAKRDEMKEDIDKFYLGELSDNEKFAEIEKLMSHTSNSFDLVKKFYMQKYKKAKI